MACFKDLPNELILEVLRYLPPTDLGSFYCIDKYIYASTAIHRISYLRLKREYSAPLTTVHSGSTAKLIQDITKEPNAALYVQHWKVDGHRDGWGFGNDMLQQTEEHRQYSDDSMMCVEEMIRNSGYVEFHEKDVWVERMRAGFEREIIALALTLLPNLTSIEFQGLEDNEQFKEILALIGPLNSRYSTASTLVAILTSLISVTIGCTNYNYGFTSKIILAFASLPSVQIINVNRMRSYSEDLTSFSQLNCTEVTDLDLSDSKFPQQFLISLLDSFKSLRSFTYWPAKACCNSEPVLIVRALYSQAPSIRELPLYSSGEPQIYTGSLRSFTVLEYLNTDLNSLPGQRDYSVLELAKRLPPSIRRLKLCDDSCIEDFMTFRESTVPKLDRIVLRLKKTS